MILAVTFFFFFLLQMDCNYPVSTPWNAVCSHRLHFRCWYVYDRHNTRGVSLWCRSFCWWWLETAKWNRVGACRASGQIHGCYSQKTFPGLMKCLVSVFSFFKKMNSFKLQRPWFTIVSSLSCLHSKYSCLVFVWSFFFTLRDCAKYTMPCVGLFFCRLCTWFMIHGYGVC